MRPTAAQLAIASGARTSTFHAVLLANDERAAETRARIQAAGLRLICLGSVPTRTGAPSTTITDPDDASQVVAEQSS